MINIMPVNIDFHFNLSIKEIRRVTKKFRTIYYALKFLQKIPALVKPKRGIN